MFQKLSPLFLTLFFCFSLHTAFPYDDVEVQGKDGVIDLRNQDFSKNLKIKGIWYFYWNQFIDPSDSSFSKDAHLIDFPKRWTDYTINGEHLPSYGYATYQAKLLLPKDSSTTFMVQVPVAYSSYKLFFNKQLVSQDGEPNTTSSRYMPHWQTKLVDIPPATDTILVTWQVANYSHSKGGVADPLIIGKKEKIELNKYRTDAIILLLTGCLIMGGLFFLALYLVGRRDSAILFFALFSILYSYRIIGTETYVLHSLFTDKTRIHQSVSQHRAIWLIHALLISRRCQQIHHLQHRCYLHHIFYSRTSILALLFQSAYQSISLCISFLSHIYTLHLHTGL